MPTAWPVPVTGLALACLSVVAGEGDTTRFKITTKRASDTVTYQTKMGVTMFTVQSPTGISQMSIERTEDRWPKAMLFRLHLQGLEGFHVSNGNETIHGAVSSQTGKARLWLAGRENTPLDSKSPFWIDIRMIGMDGKPTTTIPLKGGHFEMRLSPAILSANPRTMNVGWIDFFRN